MAWKKNIHRRIYLGASHGRVCVVMRNHKSEEGVPLTREETDALIAGLIEARDNMGEAPAPLTEDEIIAQHIELLSEHGRTIPTHELLRARAFREQDIANGYRPRIAQAKLDWINAEIERRSA